MTTARVLLVAMLATAACQPWYRDRENRARIAHDDRRTERELAVATAAHDRGQHAVAARQLRAIVDRNPDVDNRVWMLLGQVEADAGRAEVGRAYVRWRLLQIPAGSNAAVALRSFLISSLNAAGQTARALDLLQPPTVSAAVAQIPTLRPLQAALDASANDPVAALAALVAWLEVYGQPDHPLLEAARESIAVAAWRASAADATVRQLGPRARDELHHGNVAIALALYAHAKLVLPAAEFAPYRAEMEAAGATQSAAAADPAAYGFAVEGDAALRAGNLGAAQQAYRRAVANAPWWKPAVQNLAALLAIDREAP